MKKSTLFVVSMLIVFCVVSVVFGKYFIEHREGYGAINYVNANIPDGFVFTEVGEIPDDVQVSENYLDIQQIGGTFSDQFYCEKLGKNAEIVNYWNQTAGYGIIGGWSYRFAAVCGEEYVVVYGADHLGELMYGPFTLNDAQ